MSCVSIQREGWYSEDGVSLEGNIILTLVFWAIKTFSLTTIIYGNICKNYRELVSSIVLEKQFQQFICKTLCGMWVWLYVSQAVGSRAYVSSVVGFFFLFFWCKEQGFKYPKLKLNSLQSWGWPWTSDLSIFTFWVLDYKWATTCGLYSTGYRSQSLRHAKQTLY